MIKRENYVTVVPMKNGYKCAEYFWQTTGHFWDLCWASDSYATKSEAEAQAKSYADANGISYKDKP